MSVYTPSKIQDLAKSMLEVQARIENGLMTIFWSSKDQETLKKFKKTTKIQKRYYLLSCYQERHKIQNHND